MDEARASIKADFGSCAIIYISFVDFWAITDFFCTNKVHNYCT